MVIQDSLLDIPILKISKIKIKLTSTPTAKIKQPYLNLKTQTEILKPPN